MSLEHINLFMQILASLAAVIGIPIALIQYVRQNKAEERENQIRTYLQTNDRYWDYLRLCLDHPKADVFDIAQKEIEKERKLCSHEEVMLYTMMISLFERAYFLYRDQGEEFCRKQYSGWQDMVRLFAQREKFKEAWKIVGIQWDQEFQNEMNRILQS
jgi:hypothetical protein